MASASWAVDDVGSMDPIVSEDDKVPGQGSQACRPNSRYDGAMTVHATSEPVSIVFRPLEEADDVATLDAWWQDPVTVKWVGGVAGGAHLLTLSRLPGRGSTIATRNDVAVAILDWERGDTEDDAYWVDIVVAPKQRGHGYGPAVLDLLVASRPNARWVGFVSPDNTASLRMLARTGFSVGTALDEDGMLMATRAPAIGVRGEVTA